jgi:integrase/recombinase XerC
MTIQETITRYLETIEAARSKNTAETYRFALQAFANLLADNKIDPQSTPVSQLSEAAVGWFAAWLKDYAPATEQLYLQAAVGFYEYLAAEGLSAPNLHRVRQLVRMRGRKTGQRLPQFPREAIETILDGMQNVKMENGEQGIENSESGTGRMEGREKGEGADTEWLRFLRDRAFLVTLADTGLRVHEICALRRGDIDWNEGRAIIIGKGDKQAVIRFSSRSLAALKEYLSQRSKLDGASGRPLSALPLFARHDKGAGKKVKPMSTATGRHIVETRVREILGADFDGRITPHSFRHYFVTTVLRASGNLKLAQELARHTNISVTQRYAHLSDDELDRGYHEIFEKSSGE